jgi:hypothetical protein
MCEFNLLDPTISSFEFGEKVRSSATHDEVLNSNKPDKQIEYFWLTFKDSIVQYIGKQNAQNISTFSEALNILQKENQYDTIMLEISKYMKSNINTICKFIIRSKQPAPILHLHTNITRWKNIDPSFQKVIDDSILIQFLFVLSRIIKKGSDKHVNVLDFVIDTYTCGQLNVIKRKELFEYAVKNNICSIVELLLPNIDLTEYFGEDIYKYKNISTKKLIRELVKL